MSRKPKAKKPEKEIKVRLVIEPNPDPDREVRWLRDLIEKAGKWKAKEQAATPPTSE